MSADPFVLGVDQGTSATKAILVDRSGRTAAEASIPIAESHPAPDQVEQSPIQILESVRQAIAECLRDYDCAVVAGLGLSTQRESILLWDRDSGEPIGPLVSWQDCRTAADCARIDETTADRVRQLTGLPVDPMFSAPKARWLLDRYDPDRRRSADLCLGTVDSWLLGRLTGRFQIEIGNASRTQLLDIDTGQWSAELLDIFGIPRQCLPEVVTSVGPFGTLANGIAVTAVLGDSHAALYGHGGRAGNVKVTYGTGSSLLGLIDSTAEVPAGLCRTIAWHDGIARHAVEANIRATGATVHWLAGLLDMPPADIADLAGKSDSAGVHIVPAFTGLGAPWWDAAAVGLISGLTLGTERGQLARAAVESIAFQIEDVLATVDRIGRVAEVFVDGGASASDWLMQFQADIGGRTVLRAGEQGMSALGAAYLAGVAADVWSPADLAELRAAPAVFSGNLDPRSRAHLLSDWHAALDRSRTRGHDT